MYQEILTKLGLNANEAHIYELLLTKGRTKARDLLTDSGLGRGNLYNVLTSLVSQGLATVTEGKQQIYEAAEPSHLSTLVDDQKRRADRLAQEFQGELPKLLSTFNLTTGKPAIQVFEGIEGVERSLQDALLSKTDILTYYDFTALHGRLAELDEIFYRQYVKKGLHKTIVVTDSVEARTYFKEKLENTVVAFVPKFPATFYAAVQIYGDSVGFITLKEETLISIIIHDAVITGFMRQMFQFHLSLAVTQV